MAITIDGKRLRGDFDAYSAIGATENEGLHRLALSDTDREVRDRFVADLEAAGLAVWVDELGNVFGRRPGRNDDAPPVLIGSHLDSQPNGGRFDGQLGVLVALETLRAFDDEGIETDRPVEIVNWTNEEGSRFQPSMMGSGAFAGLFDTDEMLGVADRNGVTVGEELERIGYAGDVRCGPRDVSAFLELHVEQGPTLDEHGVPIGVVDGVFGLHWLRVTIHGEANHAGPTPMHARADALLAAADAIHEIGTLPGRLSTDAVTTVGETEIAPNSINVIPERATFTIDVRSNDPAVLDRAMNQAVAEVSAACERHGTEFEIEKLHRTRPMEFTPRIVEAFANATEAAGVAHERLVSGAGHDAQHLHTVTDAGMLFVPSVGGKTHTESEFTEWEDCVAGTEVFANATLDLATE